MQLVVATRLAWLLGSLQGSDPVLHTRISLVLALTRYGGAPASLWRAAPSKPSISKHYRLKRCYPGGFQREHRGSRPCLREFQTEHRGSRPVCGSFKQSIEPLGPVCGSFKQSIEALGLFAGVSNRASRLGALSGRLSKRTLPGETLLGTGRNSRPVQGPWIWAYRERWLPPVWATASVRTQNLHIP